MPEKTSTRILISDILGNSEISLINQSKNRSINNGPLNSLSEIRELRLHNANMVLIGSLNINSIRTKFDQVKDTMLKHIDILISTETKLDETFLISQCPIDVRYYIGSE